MTNTLQREKTMFIYSEVFLFCDLFQVILLEQSRHFHALYCTLVKIVTFRKLVIADDGLCFLFC